MDALVSAAGRALAAGDVLGALSLVALRDDPPALALRGIAMARLGEWPRARDLLRQAARAFGSHEPLSHARCIVADAEVALAMRDLGGFPRALATATATLDARHDHANAFQARLTAARRALLLGRVAEAEAGLAPPSAWPAPLPPMLAASAELLRAEIALRRPDTGAARAALAAAAQSAAQASLPSLLAEIDQVARALRQPAARRVSAGTDGEPLRIDEVETLIASGALVLDGCRRQWALRTERRSLVGRPILFALAECLAQAWPGDVDRQALIARVFRIRRIVETHRARLRVEIGRLRAQLAPLAGIEATARGYRLRPPAGTAVAMLAPPIDGTAASLVALLSDGAAWSTSALALALGDSQRTVQRHLATLEAGGRVRAIGQTRARRWVAPPLTGFTTLLLLPTVLPPA